MAQYGLDERREGSLPKWEQMWGVTLDSLGLTVSSWKGTLVCRWRVSSALPAAPTWWDRRRSPWDPYALDWTLSPTEESAGAAPHTTQGEINEGIKHCSGSSDSLFFPSYTFASLVRGFFLIPMGKKRRRTKKRCQPFKKLLVNFPQTHCRMQNRSLRREEPPEDIFLFICGITMPVLYISAQKRVSTQQQQQVETKKRSWLHLCIIMKTSFKKLSWNCKIHTKAQQNIVLFVGRCWRVNTPAELFTN